MSGNAYSLKHSFQNDDQQNKKTEMENISRPAAYLFTERAGHVIKVVLCNPLPLQKVCFPSQKQAIGSFLTLS